MKIHINLVKIRDIAAKGVRRTAAFMGLGLNAANNPDFNDYSLANIANIEFIKPTSNPETLEKIKEEFNRWIIGNGLRELIETFCVFLDEINVSCLLIQLYTKVISKNELQKNDNHFRRQGLKEKVKLLSSQFAIKLPNEDRYSSINQARHTLTHRRGIIGPEDCNKENKLVVKWVGLHVYAEKVSGEIISLDSIPENGVALSTGESIKVEYPERMKIFKLGSIISFTPRELAEICLFILTTTDNVIASVQKYASENNVPLMKTR